MASVKREKKLRNRLNSQYFYIFMSYRLTWTASSTVNYWVESRLHAKLPPPDIDCYFYRLNVARLMSHCKHDMFV